MKKIIAAALIALFAGAAYAEDIRVVVPYVGWAMSEYKDDAQGLDLDGGGLMEGLYLQWINPDLFQANAFLYYAADVMDAPVIGGHLIADVYVLSDPLGKLAVGAGVEVLQPGASTEVLMGPPPAVTIDVTPTITAPYARVGHYFYFGSGSQTLVSLFPWVGAEYDIVRGEVTFDPSPIPDQSIDDETWFTIAGLNLGVTFMHFIELQAKYRATFNADDFLNTFDGMLNFYLNRHWGVSYRYKYMQSTSGFTSYHIAGIAYVF
jgi:hypothetical protein